MQISIFQVDAFSSSVFTGNPAAVCPLDEWLEDSVLQAVAAENNLSETAFFVNTDSGYHLRWFTPSCEVDLCGHATLATAYVIFRELGTSETQLRFQTRSGELTVRQEGERLYLNFPARPPLSCNPDLDLIAAVGGEPKEMLTARDAVLVYSTPAEVKALQPDMNALAKLSYYATIVTAPGDDCDFVSRFFAPARGIPEDPVTGSAHCTLIPYWANRLNRHALSAKQISKRGGELLCSLQGNRVEIGGRATLFLKGTAFV
jgi:PhzF family phenazine biosynthesis protein